MRFKPFHPPHIYLDNTIYFIAARTRDKQPFFDTDSKKRLLKEILDMMIQQYSLSLNAWVILNDHYHLIVYIKNKRDLVKFTKSFHGKSAVELNKIDKAKGKKIWTNYWDHGIRDEKDYYKHFNYIHHNPVKHGYTKKMEDYQYSNYNELIKRNGKEWMESCFRSYPIVDFTAQED